MVNLEFGGSSILATQKDLLTLGHRIQSFREPLDESIRNVVIPRISANFATQGGGSWPQLAQSTTAYKAKMGYPNRMLVRTKELVTKATQLNSWDFGGDRSSATLRADRLPDYAMYHVTGTVKMPQRDWSEVTEQDVTEVENTFELWLAERIARFHAGSS